MNLKIISLLIFLSLSRMAEADSKLLLKNKNITESIPITSWKFLRDKDIIKQNIDYSCGAASIATVLTKYYQTPTTEQEVLELLLKANEKKGKASFADMQKILPELGFKGIGLATSWEQLTKLKIPVILYVLHRKQDHFTVVSGIDQKRVRLSDSSLGNRVLTRGQFKEIWEVRSERDFEGKMLAILPLDKNLSNSVNKNFIREPSFNPVTKELLRLRR